MKKCNLQGRDCFQENWNATFNCQTSCQGIYADIVQWGDRGIIETMKDMMKPLFEEYKTFKQKQIRHFGFNATACSTMFGKKNLIGNVNVNIYKGFFLGSEQPPSTLQIVQIQFSTSMYEDIERDKKIKTEAQLSLIGGTMGLLTGFSIISGVEIVFFLFRSSTL